MNALCFSEKYYTTDHEYIDVPEGQDIGTVGITDYAQVSVFFMLKSNEHEVYQVQNLFVTLVTCNSAYG